jgi:hypothetical protein
LGFKKDPFRIYNRIYFILLAGFITEFPMTGFTYLTPKGAKLKGGGGLCCEEVLVYRLMLSLSLSF